MHHKRLLLKVLSLQNCEGPAVQNIAVVPLVVLRLGSLARWIPCKGSGIMRLVVQSMRARHQVIDKEPRTLSRGDRAVGFDKKSLTKKGQEGKRPESLGSRNARNPDGIYPFAIRAHSPESF